MGRKKKASKKASKRIKEPHDEWLPSSESEPETIKLSSKRESKHPHIPCEACDSGRRSSKFIAEALITKKPQDVAHLSGEEYYFKRVCEDCYKNADEKVKHRPFTCFTCGVEQVTSNGLKKGKPRFTQVGKFWVQNCNKCGISEKKKSKKKKRTKNPRMSQKVQDDAGLMAQALQFQDFLCPGNECDCLHRFCLTYETPEIAFEVLSGWRQRAKELRVHKATCRCHLEKGVSPTLSDDEGNSDVEEDDSDQEEDDSDVEEDDSEQEEDDSEEEEDDPEEEEEGGGRGEEELELELEEEDSRDEEEHSDEDKDQPEEQEGQADDDDDDDDGQGVRRMFFAELQGKIHPALPEKPMKGHESQPKHPKASRGFGMGRKVPDCFEALYLSAMEGGGEELCPRMKKKIFMVSLNFLYKRRVAPGHLGGSLVKGRPKEIKYQNSRQHLKKKNLLPLGQVLHMKCCKGCCLQQFREHVLLLHREKYLTRSQRNKREVLKLLVLGGGGGPTQLCRQFFKLLLGCGSRGLARVERLRSPYDPWVHGLTRYFETHRPVNQTPLEVEKQLHDFFDLVFNPSPERKLGA